MRTTAYPARRGFDPADYARRIADIFVEERIVGRGMAIAAAIYLRIPLEPIGEDNPNVYLAISSKCPITRQRAK